MPSGPVLFPFSSLDLVLNQEQAKLMRTGGQPGLFWPAGCASRKTLFPSSAVLSPLFMPSPTYIFSKALNTWMSPKFNLSNRGLLSICLLPMGCHHLHDFPKVRILGIRHYACFLPSYCLLISNNIQPYCVPSDKPGPQITHHWWNALCGWSPCSTYKAVLQGRGLSSAHTLPAKPEFDPWYQNPESKTQKPNQTK